MSEPSRLARRLGTFDAVVVGLGSMVGAGIFAALSPAARAAGSALLLGLVLAGAVAYCNASSSARLAALYPESGGTYVYGRERLGDLWGYLAGSALRRRQARELRRDGAHVRALRRAVARAPAGGRRRGAGSPQ